MSHFYLLLLRLYPRAFRERYANEMLRAYADRRLDARPAGVWALLRFEAAAVKDLLINAAAEGAHGRGSSFTSLTQDARFALRMLWRRVVNGQPAGISYENLRDVGVPAAA